MTKEKSFTRMTLVVDSIQGLGSCVTPDLEAYFVASGMRSKITMVNVIIHQL